ncbi:15-hydroxyprostaglandin dehydrogenase [NAD(+)]-like [Eucyclogobius newberryi]|uniref:15-hydroxyprostaglandin dehydrogenase [NAD(+)]-like n=1 Tax=Eucyclogobius newberryi TaxID=166745 RepID=UPI003B5A1815
MMIRSFAALSLVWSRRRRKETPPPLLRLPTADAAARQSLLPADGSSWSATGRAGETWGSGGRRRRLHGRVCRGDIGGEADMGPRMTEELLKHGAKVALLDVNAEAGESLTKTLETKFGKEKTIFIECNVQSKEQLKVCCCLEAAFQKTVDTFGGLDIVCNNAGVLNETEWETTVSINLVRTRSDVTKASYKLNLWRGDAAHISSTGLGPLPSCPVYTATKYGVIGFTRAMAMASLGSDSDVRFIALCPSFVNTDLLRKIPESLGRFAHLNELTQGLLSNIGVMRHEQKEVELCASFRFMQTGLVNTSVSRVGEALIELLSEETKTGAALIVMPEGNKYAAFPSEL